MTQGSSNGDRLEVVPPEDARERLDGRSLRWLVTGAAGFIGSNLLETLLTLGQEVVGLDDFSSGRWANLEDVEGRVGPERWRRFELVEGDIRDPDACRRAAEGADVVLHEAAVASVPASIERPAEITRINVEGFVNVLEAARAAGVLRVVYASSSAVYGDDDAPSKREDRLGASLSPYGASKRANELYAETYAAVHGMRVVGLRYFNVFGRRQDPEGYYAAVIPRWIDRSLRGEPCIVYGDGSTTRDFCHVDDVVQANLLAALQDPVPTGAPVFNVGNGVQTSLLDLHRALDRAIATAVPGADCEELLFEPFRPGDIHRSGADVTRARVELGFAARVPLHEGLADTAAWYAGRDPMIARSEGRTRRPEGEAT